ncbi:MAG: hypothetical protein E6K54_05075 [Gammaproteobacteria bacterium]|nr:MAG: hypothetical protein E6K54_05075 [Gammaproteobacteria bacterium]
MPTEHITNRELMAMVNHFSEYKIMSKYFPLMYESPLIMESLKLIYILSYNKKFNSEDILLVKLIFKESFKFFSEAEMASEAGNESSNNSANNKYSKKNLFLSVLFCSLMLVTGIGCIYSTFIFIPLVIMFGIGLAICTCLISVKNRPVEIIIPKFDEIYKACKSELNTLKKNLDKLRNFFAEKYKIKMTNVDSVYITLADKQTENFPSRKKSVTFAPKLNELNLFNIETPESRSRANSYENNGDFRPTL